MAGGLLVLTREASTALLAGTEGTRQGCTRVGYTGYPVLLGLRPRRTGYMTSSRTYGPLLGHVVDMTSSRTTSSTRSYYTLFTSYLGTGDWREGLRYRMTESEDRRSEDEVIQDRGPRTGGPRSDESGPIDRGPGSEVKRCPASDPRPTGLGSLSSWPRTSTSRTLVLVDR